MHGQCGHANCRDVNFDLEQWEAFWARRAEGWQRNHRPIYKAVSLDIARYFENGGCDVPQRMRPPRRGLGV
ncbi:hypothetical protein CEXT_636311 [Caerostris extrusa]|uniref:Uncharacterized protein n=1 Tax=Caerostris extrusa TaxID=172846 RepID=A0AAV4RJK6_CAEEX|nr:hypothetical protein CEXT_636311 [Caerostris extrusa]